MRQDTAGKRTPISRRNIDTSPINSAIIDNQRPETNNRHVCTQQRKEPPMSELHRITIDADHCGGRPAIRGLRIRVKDILDLLAAGASREEILQDYPYLEPEDITAALEFAARQSDHVILRVA